MDPVVYASEFGVISNDPEKAATNDLAMAAAIAHLGTTAAGSLGGGGALILPSGVTHIASTIRLEGRWAIRIVGFGGRQATVKGGTYTQGSVLQWHGPAEGPMLCLDACQRCVIEGVMFDANSLARIGIALDSTAHATIGCQLRHCYVRAVTPGGIGILIGGAADGLQVSDCLLEQVAVDSGAAAATGIVQRGNDSNVNVLRQVQFNVSGKNAVGLDIVGGDLTAYDCHWQTSNGTIADVRIGTDSLWSRF